MSAVRASRPRSRRRRACRSARPTRAARAAARSAESGSGASASVQQPAPERREHPRDDREPPKPRRGLIVRRADRRADRRRERRVVAAVEPTVDERPAERGRAGREAGRDHGQGRHQRRALAVDPGVQSDERVGRVAGRPGHGRERRRVLERGRQPALLRGAQERCSPELLQVLPHRIVGRAWLLVLLVDRRPRPGVGWRRRRVEASDDRRAPPRRRRRGRARSTWRIGAHLSGSPARAGTRPRALLVRAPSAGRSGRRSATRAPRSAPRLRATTGFRAGGRPDRRTRREDRSATPSTSGWRRAPAARRGRARSRFTAGRGGRRPGGRSSSSHPLRRGVREARARRPGR